MSTRKNLYIIGKYVTKEVNQLPLFIYLRPKNIVIIKVEKPKEDINIFKKKLLNIVSKFFVDFQELYSEVTEVDILSRYKEYLPSELTDGVCTKSGTD